MRAAVIKTMVVLAAAGTLGACNSIKDHRGYLVDYLQTRGMYLGVRDFEPTDD